MIKDVIEIKQKRGRKPKNAIKTDCAKNDVKNDCANDVKNDCANDVKNDCAKNDCANDVKNDCAKNDCANDVKNDCVNDSNIIFSIEENDTNDVNLTTIEEQKPIGKKRGRKPKGGKIIQQVIPINNNKETKPNVILHLKCSLKDLQTNSSISTNIESFNFSAKNDLNYEIISSNIQNSCFSDKTQTQNNNYSNHEVKDDDEDDDYYSKCKNNDIREVWKKLKQLQHNLHINNISNKKSACFWCTCDFDNPPIYIPKHFIKDSYHVYGCFCSPECAVAHLMEENIDSSAKFERYHLINNIYSKIYDYNKNIKPAPNPFYLLDKYYGNLSVQEYRSLLRNERLFLVVDKPLTRILPELHEDNDDFIINNKIIPANTLVIKKKIQRNTQTKTNILNEKFGLTQ